MGFPEEIKRIRQRCFFTQHDFAKEVQVAFSTVNRWEGGKAKPNLITMKKLRISALRTMWIMQVSKRHGLILK